MHNKTGGQSFETKEKEQGKENTSLVIGIQDQKKKLIMQFKTKRN